MIPLLLLALLSPEDPAALSQAGAEALRQQRFPEAIRIYRQLASQPNAIPQWRFNLGLALHSAGQFREALPEFQAFLRTNPAPGPAHLLAGVAHLKLNAPCPAIPLLETARRWRSSREVTGTLSDAYFGCRRYSDAAPLFLSLGEPRSAAHAFYLARDYARAQTLFASLAPQFPNDPRFLFEYGDTLLRHSGAEAALPVLLRAASLPEARASLAKAYIELDRCSDAIPHLEFASPLDPALLLPLSRCYRSAGRLEDAARANAEYQRRLAASPDARP